LVNFVQTVFLMIGTALLTIFSRIARFNVHDQSRVPALRGREIGQVALSGREGALSHQLEFC
jgi:hypothetical protein